MPIVYHGQSDHPWIPFLDWLTVKLGYTSYYYLVSLAHLSQLPPGADLIYLTNSNPHQPNQLTFLGFSILRGRKVYRLSSPLTDWEVWLNRAKALFPERVLELEEFQEFGVNPREAYTNLEKMSIREKE